MPDMLYRVFTFQFKLLELVQGLDLSQTTGSSFFGLIGSGIIHLSFVFVFLVFITSFVNHHIFQLLQQLTHFSLILLGAQVSYKIAVVATLKRIVVIKSCRELCGKTLHSCTAARRQDRRVPIESSTDPKFCAGSVASPRA